MFDLFRLPGQALIEFRIAVNTCLILHHHVGSWTWGFTLFNKVQECFFYDGLKLSTFSDGNCTCSREQLRVYLRCKTLFNGHL